MRIRQLTKNKNGLLSYIGGENMLKVITGEAERSISCYDDQICAGLKEVIEGVIHDVKYL